MKKNDIIEIYCPKCDEINSLPFENSLKDQVITCKNCGIRIYWKNCPKCDTGWYTLNKDEECPSCNDSNNDTTDSKPTTMAGKAKKLIYKVFLLLLTLIIAAALMIFTKILFVYIQHLLFSNPNIIFISPGDASLYMSFISFLLFVLGIGWFVINCFYKNFHITASVFCLLLILPLVITIFNYTAFYNNKIVTHSIFSSNTYSYNNIKAIHVSYDDKYGTDYDLVMKDNTTINMLTLDENLTYVIMVQNKIMGLKLGIPQTMTADAYSVLSQKIHPKSLLKQQFKIID